MGEDDTCATFIVGINPYLATQLFYYRSAYRQSETRALTELIQLLETFEHQFGFLLGYATTRVANTDTYNVVVRQLIKLDSDGSAFGELLSIVEQIGKHL